MRKVVLAIVDSVRHILCMRIVTQCIYEETRGRNGLYTVTKCAREESEECEKFHFMNVEVQKRFNFFVREVRNRRFCKKRMLYPWASLAFLQLLAPAIYIFLRRCGTLVLLYMTMRAFGFSSTFASISARRSAGVFAENTCQYMSLLVRRLTP